VRLPLSRQATPLRGTLAVGLGCALVAWAVAGAEGLSGAVVGTVVVVAFFASGTVPVFLAGEAGLRAGAGVALLLLTYVLRWLLVLGALALAATSDLVDIAMLGVTVIVCALAWSALQLSAVLRANRST
jgi:hypothetical protein